MDRKLWFACVLFVTCQIAIALDVTVQQFKESPGLYYDYIGEARLYSTEWKFVTYINPYSTRATSVVHPFKLLWYEGTHWGALPPFKCTVHSSRGLEL